MSTLGTDKSGVNICVDSTGVDSTGANGGSASSGASADREKVPQALTAEIPGVPDMCKIIAKITEAMAHMTKAHWIVCGGHKDQYRSSNALSLTLEWENNTQARHAAFKLYDSNGVLIARRGYGGKKNKKTSDPEAELASSLFPALYPRASGHDLMAFGLARETFSLEAMAAVKSLGHPGIGRTALTIAFVSAPRQWFFGASSPESIDQKIADYGVGASCAVADWITTVRADTITLTVANTTVQRRGSVQQTIEAWNDYAPRLALAAVLAGVWTPRQGEADAEKAGDPTCDLTCDPTGKPTGAQKTRRKNTREKTADGGADSRCVWRVHRPSKRCGNRFSSFSPDGAIPEMSDVVIAANENEAYLRNTLLNLNDGLYRFDTLVNDPDFMRKDLAITKFVRLHPAPSPDQKAILERVAARQAQ